MNRICVGGAALAIAGLAAGGCASTAEPRVETVVVKEPVPMPCPDRRDPRPVYVDTVEALKAEAAAGRFDRAFALALGGREQRIAREAANEAQIAACARGGAPPGG